MPYNFARKSDAEKCVHFAQTYLMESGGPVPNALGREIVVCKTPPEGIPIRSDIDGDTVAGKADCEVIYLGDSGIMSRSGQSIVVWNIFGSAPVAGDVYIIVGWMNHMAVVMSEDC